MANKVRFECGILLALGGEVDSMSETKGVPKDVRRLLEREGLTSGNVLEQLDEGQPDETSIAGGLQPIDREVLVDRLDGRTYADIGKEHGVTRQRIMQRLARAFRSLRTAKIGFNDRK